MKAASDALTLPELFRQMNMSSNERERISLMKFGAGLGSLRAGVPVTSETLCKSLLLNHVPLIVTNSLFFSKENLPHWVAVTGIDGKFMYFNNPSDTNPKKRKIELPDLQEFVGYHGDQSMVEVWRP